MNKKLAALISSITFVCGLLLFMIHYDWIIIRFTQPVSATLHTAHTKKVVSLSFWNNNRWHTESQELIWSSEAVENLTTLVSSWLALLDVEQITPKKVSLQGVSIAPNQQDFFVSFDRNPFSKAWSIKKKWMLIEGLLKTVHNNLASVQTVQFLVRHQPLSDPHLDFSSPWPITGFSSSQLQ